MHQLVEKLRAKQPKARKELYQFLYQKSFAHLKSTAIGDAEAVVIFQDSFLILTRQLCLGKLESKAANISLFMRKLQQVFERIWWRQVYSLERSTIRVLAGVQAENRYANAELAGRLSDNNWRIYCQRLQQQFHLQSLSGDDIMNSCSSIVFENIRAGKFQLDAAANNELNKNKLFRYYKEILFRWSNKQNKRQKIEASTEDVTVLERADETTEYLASLRVHVHDLLEDLDEAGRYILEGLFVQQLSAKQVAKQSPYPDYQSTAAVQEKKLACLTKLKKDLVYTLAQLDTAALDQLQLISTYTLEQLQEPCKTILQCALPPNENSMGEIVQKLQESRPKSEIATLHTTQQLKKRKYKCLHLLHTALWGALLNSKEA